MQKVMIHTKLTVSLTYEESSPVTELIYSAKGDSRSSASSSMLGTDTEFRV
jgi:hypothetical protein